MKQFYEPQNLLTKTRKLLKRIWQGFMVLSLLIAFSSKTKATQLSGTYTINPGGTASATVFKNFSSAVTYMTSTSSRSDGGPANSGTVGVSGPVIFKVSAGTYTESIGIYSNIAGSSTTNTISFIGAGRYNTILTSSGQPLGLQTSYISFSCMAFVTTSIYSNTVNANYCSYVSITNCNITAPTNGNGENLATFGDNYCTIDHDYISGDAIAVILQGYQGTSSAPNGNWTFTNNRITHFSAYGIYAYNSSTYGDFNSNISNNIIDSTVNPVSYGNGILSYFQNGATIANNQVLDTVGNALQMYAPNYTDNSVPFRVYNNFFSNYTANCYIQFPSSTSINLFVEHNTFYNNATNYALSLYINDNTNITVENNIFYNVSNSNPAAFYSNGGSFPFTGVNFDGNDYYNGASGGALVSMNGTSYTSLSTYKTAMSSYSYDQAATSVLPSIVSGSHPYNIHITTGASYPTGINAGITTDLFGVQRSSTSPAAGAVEPTPGGYLNFSGSSNYVSVNNSLGNFGTGDFTIQFRFRSTSTSIQYFVSKRNTCEHSNFISVDMNNGVMECETDDATNYSGMTSGSHKYNDGNWHQYSEVRKSGTLYMYVDGNLVNSTSSASNISNNYTMNLGSSVCNVGSESNGSVIYNGDLDEVRFWSRALCISEINNNLSCELSGTQTDLVAYYKFNEGIASANNSSVTSLTDASGNSNTGTLNNFSLSGSSSNWIDGGVSGSCSVYTSPDMAVTNIANGGSANSFGTVTNGSSASETFTITNSGDGALNIDSISFSGTNAGDFKITSSPASSVASNTSATFTVTFTPTGSGSETAALSIANNDLCNNNNPYVINLTGTGGCTAPTINSQPSSATVCSGTDAVFAVDASGTDLTYQWQLSTDNGSTFSNISGATSSTYTVSAPAVTSNGNTYMCIVTSSGCASTSSTAASLTVNSAPVFAACPSNITASASNSSCDAAVNYTATITGTPDPSVSYSFSGATTGSGDGTGSGSTFNKGITTVSISASNTCGSATSCSFTVTVIDDTKPTAIAKDMTVYLDANGAATISASDIDNGSTDNCSVSLSIDKTSFSCANTGSNTVTLTATDPSENYSTATSTVTVLDTTRPTMSTQNLTVYLDANGKASITAAGVNNGSSDNCHIASISLDDSLFNCSNIGSNNIVKLTAIDASGNTNYAYATITVKDTTKPVVITQNVLVTLNSSNMASITVAAVNNGSIDNCSIASYTLSKTSFDCSNVGNNTVTLSVTDGSGNVGTATAIVTVKDPTPPVAKAKNITVYLDSTGHVTVAGKSADNGSSDNCSVVSYTLNPSTFTCTNTGFNKATLTVADAWGNTNSATCYITVKDNMIPVAKAKNVTVYLNASGRATLHASDLDNGSYDNCSFVLAFDHDGDEWSPNSDDLTKYYDCDDIGTHKLNLYAIDKNNNASYATATVTVKDTTRPVIVVRNFTAYLDNNGNANVSTRQVDNGSYDNCGIVSETLSQSSFNCAGTGKNTVTVTAKDVSGNTATAIVTINVIDNTSPNVRVKNITAYLDVNGTATITPSMVNNGSSDNCSIATMSLSKSTFACSDAGNNTVTLTVKDGSGNTSSANANVYVRDTISPVVKTNNLTVYIDKNGNASVNINSIVSSATDNCGVDIAFDRDGHTRHGHVRDNNNGHHWCNENNSDDTLKTFSCANIGKNTVTVYAIDPSGNVSTSSAIVTVKDTTRPVIKTKNITVTLNSKGLASISANDIDKGSYDNCSIASASLGKTSFNCDDLGANAITYTVKDPSGNVATALVTVTVNTSLSVDAGSKQVVYYGYAPNASATLSAKASGGTGCSYSYKWSTGAKTQSITVSPSVTTWYYVTVTDGNGCTAMDSVQVESVDVRCNENGGSVLVCLKGTTYCLSSSSVPAYLKKGASLGSCDADAPISQNESDAFGITLSAYPNPFNTGTTISFTVPANNNVTLDLYNLKGEKVSTIFNGEADMNNIYTFDLKPAYLAPGVYMVRLTTPNDVKYIKLVKFE